MAAVTGASSISLLRSAPQQFHQNLALSRTNGLKSVSLAGYGRSSLSLGLQQRSLRLSVSCAVEIVMGLEEEFGISVEEDSAQAIATVQDAADLIEKLIEKNKA
ncbi:unnamed protein product [Malus baccata var. baccata]